MRRYLVTLCGIPFQGVIGHLGVVGWSSKRVVDNGLEYYNFIFDVFCLYLLWWGILKQSNNIL
jgi:hypothetical protein